ncbi:hypothetical protein [Leptospira idonii]|uniref:Uncharacterized protein n=1 Tax=Leptospira idonii TaxID=1193500 RepID=A0A4R9LVK1_9LEPT|nr:hypothetical protein [Leptospira idonii]TGN18220.1 hypothetical protein EHS15_12470 [Leptospira idonii]
MKFLLFSFFSLILFTTNVSAEEKPSLVWDNLLISYEDKEKKIIVFRPKKSKQSVFKIDHSEIGSSGEIGLYKSKFGNLFYNYYHSGGESGGSYQLDLYDHNGRSVKRIVSLEASGRGKIEIIHLHPYWKEEMMRFNELFYGREDWSFEPLYQTGFGEIVFPEFFILDKNIKGKYELANVSFKKQNRFLLQPYFESAEKKIDSIFGSSAKQTDTAKNDPNLAGVLQYYLYKSKLGEEKDALSKLEKYKIQINYQGKRIPLLSFLKEKREEILKR